MAFKGKWFNNPGKTGKKYCQELHTGKNAKTGEKLTDKQKSYRAGYTAARSDSVHVYNYKKGKVAK